MNKALSFFLFLFSFLSAAAQITDSVQAVVNPVIPNAQVNEMSKPPRLFLKLDTRNSFITNTRADIWGVKAGVRLAGKMKAGIGYSRLHTKFQKNIFIGADTFPARLQFSYSVLYFEYVFYAANRWEFSVPLQLGAGNAFYRYSYNGKQLERDKHVIMLYEPSVSWQYKITRWFGIGGDIGYRLMLIKNKMIPENFNSPVYSFKAILYYEELYRMIFKKPFFGK